MKKFLLVYRGCPFPRSHSQNEYLRDLYQGHGQFVRLRSIDNILAEVDVVIQKYKIPFLCQTRPDLINAETIAMLKEANCDFIRMTIESGKPRTRRQILKRFYMKTR